jgi:hypothetical protein
LVYFIRRKKSVASLFQFLPDVNVAKKFSVTTSGS